MRLFCIYDSVSEKPMMFFQAHNYGDACRFVRQSFSTAQFQQVDGFLLLFVGEVDVVLESTEGLGPVCDLLPHLADEATRRSASRVVGLSPNSDVGNGQQGT